MNRRDFLNMSAGGAVVAVLPVAPALASPAAQVPRHLYVWAVAMARAGNPISSETLSKALKVTADEARALINRLVARGVVGTPNAMGVARTAQPAFRNSGGVLHSSPSHAKPAMSPQQNKVLRRLHQEIGRAGTETKPAEFDLNPPDDDSVPQEVSDATRSTE